MNNLQRQMQRSLQLTRKAPAPNETVGSAATVRLQRLDVARAALEPGDDCSNSDCPYRVEVLAARERNRQKVAKYRAKRKGKA